VKAGIPIRGLLHDLSKFRPSEFESYSRFFNGNSASDCKVQEAFNFAWLLHQKRNDHHWQWWILREDDGGVKIFPMSRKARLEMLCDWIGAGRTYGSKTPEWYDANKHRMLLHDETRIWVERQIAKL
jgi:hypothetical protein